MISIVEYFSVNTFSGLLNEFIMGQVSEDKSATGLGFSIMSKGYRQSLYTNATFMRCNIVPLDINEDEAEMKLYVRDFAPFIYSSHFCLSINGREKVCSGSGIVENHVGIYKGTQQWTLMMDMKKPLEDIPQVRFWMHIFIGQYIY